MGASIVQVADYSPNYSGNFIASLRALAAQYGKLGLRPVWVFPDEARSRAWLKELADDPAASVYVLPRRRTGHLRYAWELAHIIWREKSAILHTHFSRFDIAAWMAKAMCALAGKHVELVWHQHSAFAPRSSRTRLALDALKLGMLGRWCRLVPVCEDLRLSIEQKGCPPERVRVIPNGIDTAHCAYRSRPREQVRGELAVPQDTLLLLGLGWEPVRKGVDTMLAGLERVIAGGRKAVLVLVGTDDRLPTFVDQWPVRSVLPFVRVISSVEHVGDLYGAADVFVSASRAEGFNYSVAEAMVNGVPVVSTRIPSLAWAFEAPGVFFFPVDNGEELADVIGRIADRSDKESRRDAEAGERFVCERYSVEKWAQSVLHLYEDLLPQ